MFVGVVFFFAYQFIFCFCGIATLNEENCTTPHWFMSCIWISVQIQNIDTIKLEYFHLRQRGKTA